MAQSLYLSLSLFLSLSSILILIRPRVVLSRALFGAVNFAVVFSNGAEEPSHASIWNGRSGRRCERSESGWLMVPSRWMKRVSRACS